MRIALARSDSQSGITPNGVARVGHEQAHLALGAVHVNVLTGEAHYRFAISRDFDEYAV